MKSVLILLMFFIASDAFAERIQVRKIKKELTELNAMKAKGVTLMA